MCERARASTYCVSVSMRVFGLVCVDGEVVVRPARLKPCAWDDPPKSVNWDNVRRSPSQDIQLNNRSHKARTDQPVPAPLEGRAQTGAKLDRNTGSMVDGHSVGHCFPCRRTYCSLSDGHDHCDFCKKRA